MHRGPALTTLVLALAGPIAPAATASDPPRDCTGSYWDEHTEPAARQPPAGFTRALVLDRLGVGPRICGFAVKRWGRGSLYVAVVELDRALVVGVFEAGDSIRLRARGRLLLGESAPRFHHFDFAPYRIDTDELAFGLRTAHRIAYAGGGGQCQGLTLFRLRGGRLDPILATQMDYGATIRGAPLDDGTYALHDVAARATLSVSDRRSEGLFEFRKAIRRSDQDGRQERTVVLRSRGGRYQSESDLELLEVNCLVPGFDLEEATQRPRFPEWVAY